VIDNPDIKSEQALLRSYAPSMSQHLLDALTSSFAELRSLNEGGLLAYPYSTRELVAIATHLEVRHLLVYASPALFAG